MKYRDVRKMLESRGFNHVRRADGSHNIFERGGQRVIVPEHHKGEIPPFIVKQLLKITGGV